MNTSNYLYEDYEKSNRVFHESENKTEEYKNKMLELLPKKGLVGATKTNYEKILEFFGCLDYFNKNKDSNWFKSRCEVTDFPSDMENILEDTCSMYFDAFKNYIESDSFTSPMNTIYKKYSSSDIETVNHCLHKMSYSLFGVDDLDKIFGRFVKNYDKLKPELEAEKKAAEEEAYKALNPDPYTPTDVYDSTKLRDFKAVSKAENSYVSQAVTKRARMLHSARTYKNGTKFDIINECLSEIFCSIDNSWFSFVCNGDELNFDEADEIEAKWRKRSSEEKLSINAFLDAMASTTYAVGGGSGIWDIKHCLYSAAKARLKVTGVNEVERKYKNYERSIDSIVDENGNPVLNDFLNNWVNDMVNYYTDKDNISLWNKNKTNYAEKIEDLNKQKNDYKNNWIEAHKNDENVTYFFKREGYTKEYDYANIVGSQKYYENALEKMNRNIEISNMGKDKIYSMYRKQADDVKRDFVMRVCDLSGVVSDGRFWWAQTGHLNGWVKGVNGTFKVTSFFAGGYNIQVLHCRTRITKLNK